MRSQAEEVVEVARVRAERDAVLAALQVAVAGVRLCAEDAAAVAKLPPEWSLVHGVERRADLGKQLRAAYPKWSRQAVPAMARLRSRRGRGPARGSMRRATLRACGCCAAGRPAWRRRRAGAAARLRFGASARSAWQQCASKSVAVAPARGILRAAWWLRRGREAGPWRACQWTSWCLVVGATRRGDVSGCRGVPRHGAVAMCGSPVAEWLQATEVARLRGTAASGAAAAWAPCHRGLAACRWSGRSCQG